MSPKYRDLQLLASLNVLENTTSVSSNVNVVSHYRETERSARFLSNAGL